MKINVITLLLFVGILLIVSGSYALAHTDVTAEEAKELIDSTDDLTVIDVREPSEYSGTRGHIPGALNYPWNSGVLQARYEELPADGPVLVVCASGGRSNRAANFLDSKDFSMVYDMLGGMSAWKWETETDVDPDSKYGGGTGEPNDPYLIYTAEQLNTIGAEPNDWDKHFKLMVDIDLSDYTGTDFNIIGLDMENPFTGLFDGNGYTISNYSYTSDERSYIGIFGCVGLQFNKGEIRDLGLLDAVVDAGEGSCVGSLVGQLHDGTITNCYCKNVSVSGGNKVGGLVGGNGGTITNCYAIGSVYRFGPNWYGGVGGLAGFNNAMIKNCYAAGSVTGNTTVGGLLGMNSGHIVTCYSTSSVSGTENVGGLMGMAWGGSVVDSFWDIETSGQATSDEGVGITTAEMQTTGTFLDAGWDFVGESVNGTEDIWSICEGTNYPRFVWQIPLGDFICPDGITMDDFFFLLEFWLNDNCDSSNDFCQGTDLDQSGKVDEDDLELFFESWLAEK